MSLVLLVVASACVDLRPACSASTCEGCCDVSGVCRTGLSTDACGAAGASCAVCTEDQSCRAAQCAAVPTGGGGGNVVVTPPDCTVPSTLDFGAVIIGETKTRDLAIDNVSNLEETVSVSAPQTPGFAVTPTGALILSPGMKQRVSIDFAPTEARGYTTQVSVQRGVFCPTVNMLVRGEGRNDRFNWSPGSIDFGFVQPGAALARLVTFDNPSNMPMLVTQLTASGAFSLADAAALHIPARGSATATVVFRPTELGSTDGAFTFVTDVPGQTNGSVSLHGVGGGPTIEAPIVLNLPSGPYPVSQTGKIAVRNIGHRPLPLDPAGNLHFATPPFSVSPLSGSVASEFSVTFPPSYDALVGLEVGAPPLLLDVTFTPQTTGRKSVAIQLFTNDFLNAQHVVVVNAEAMPNGPCTYSVSPAALDLGLVRPGGTRTQSVIITNTGVANCMIFSAAPVDGSLFRAATFAPVSLAGGATFEVSVSFHAPSSVPSVAQQATDVLRITTDSVAAPSTDLTLAAAYGPDCLVMSDALDFGNGAVGCGTGSRRVTVINTCATSVTLSAAAVVGSSKFTVANPAGVTLAPQASHVFSVEYRPTGVTYDLARLTFTSTRSMGSELHSVELEGEGHLSPDSTDVFTVPFSRPRSDVLFVVDDSASMVDKRDALATALTSSFPSFLMQALDLRFGVITTDLTSAGRARLRRTSTGAKWVATSTPNASVELRALLNVGTTGDTESCLEPANLALSDEYRSSTTYNSSFLRQLSHLAVVCVTDANEQSPNPIAYDLLRLSMVNDPQRPEATSYSVIGPFLPSAPAPCVYDDPNVNGKHDAALTEFGGAREEICTTNWPVTVSNIIERAVFTPRRQFTLRRRVDATSPNLRVEINGVTVPAVSGGQTNWTFDVAKNQLVFSKPSAPPSGVDINVSYKSLCF